eukprot:UC1_evm3s2143
MNRFAGMSGGGGAERTTFVGAVVPPEIKALPRLLSKLPEEHAKATFEGVLALAVAHVAGESVAEGAAERLVVEGAVSIVQVQSLFIGLSYLVRAALRTPPEKLKKIILREDLEALKFDAACVKALVKALAGPERAARRADMTEAQVQLPRLDAFKWRVDVAISTSALERSLKPNVLMQMTLSDGRVHTFEVTAAEFHKLRYNVAFVLKEMEDLSRKQVMA